MQPKVTESHISFKKKPAGQTPIRQMNKSQVSVTSEVSQSRSQKSVSQGHSRLLKSGHQTLLEKMAELPDDIVKLKQQNAQLRIMELSEDARQSLMKLQRFDRFIFPLESDRILKKPIQNELMRLQKIKNEQQEMRGKLYDNQLTITALYNHIKLIWEMNRQLEERQVLRKEKDEAVKKMHEQKRESLKQVRQLKQQMRSAGKNLTPVKNERPQLQPPQTTPLKKEQVTALNFISATLRGKKYAEALEEVKKFITKSSSTQPEACRLLEMFLPALDDQLSTLVQTKTVQTKLTETTILIQKINKQIRLNHYEELEKIKNEALKANSAFKNIGLLLESMLNAKKMDEAEKLKKNIPTDSRSIDKVNQRMKTVEDELKSTKEQLFRERVTNADNLKLKQALEKQVQKLKMDFDRATQELQNLKKIEIEQSKRNLPPKPPVSQNEIKAIKEELNQQRALKQNLERQIGKIRQEVEIYKRNEAEAKKSTSRNKTTDDELKSLREQIANERNAKLNLQRENQRIQNQIKGLKDQLNTEKTSKINIQKETQRIQSQLETVKRSEAEMKRSVSRLKQNDDELKNVREQLNAERTAKVTLQREAKKVQNQIKILRDEANNQKTTNSQLQNQIQRLHTEIQKVKKELVESKRLNLKTKQNEDERVLKVQLEAELQKTTAELRKTQSEAKKTAIKIKQSEEQLKVLRQQLHNQVSKSSSFAQYIQRLETQIQQNKKAANQVKRIVNKSQQNEDEIRSLRDQLSQARASNNQLSRVNKSQEKQIQGLKNENQKIRRLETDLQILKKSEAESKKSLNKAKSIQDELAKVKEQLANQKYENTENIRVRKNTQNLLEKVKADNERLRTIESSYEDLKHSEGEFKRASQKLKSTHEQFRIAKQELESQRSKNYGLSREKEQLERQIEKLMSEIDMYRKNEVQIKAREFETIKKFEVQARTKQELLIQNLKQDIEKSEFSLNFSLDSLEKIAKASTAVKPLEDLQRIRKQLTSSHHSTSRKLLPLLETYIRSHNRSTELQGLIEKMGREENERRKKFEAEAKGLNSQLAELRQNSNLICQGLKSAARTWARTKSEQLFTDNKIIQILGSELKKGNHNHSLEHIQFEIIAAAESLVNIMIAEISKSEDRFIKQLEQKNRQIEKLNSKQQLFHQNEAERNQRVIDLEEQVKNSHNSSEQLRKQCTTYIKQLERMIKEHSRVIQEANLHSEQLSKQVQANAILNRDILQLKKQVARVIGEKEVKENALKEAEEEISRLKRHTQSFVEQEKKVLESLQFEGKEKQKFQRQLESLHRSLEKMEKQKQFFERKTKTQDADLLKLKQLQISLQNSIQQSEIKKLNFQNTILARDRQLKNLHEKNRIMLEQKDKADQHILILEKQLASMKFEAEKANRQVKDNEQLFEKQKHDLSREIQRLNMQIKYSMEQKQSQKKHFSTIIARLQKNLSDAEAHRIQQVKEIQIKMQLILKEKEEARKEMENEQNRYREKLREVNRDLELTSNTGEKEKVQMKRQIDRLTLELTNFVQSNQFEKNELRKTVEKLMAEKQKLVQERVEEKRLCLEEIERAKNDEYQMNYEKLKKQREEIRSLQEEVDKLNQVIDINELNYNKIVEDNRQMFDRISELESSQKNYSQEVQMLKDKSVGELNNAHLQVSRNTELVKQIEKLEAQIKEFEIIIATNSRQIAFIDSQKTRMKELQSRVDELQHENIKLKVHEDENLKQINRYKQENIQLRTENAAIDRELYATKSRPDSSQNEALLLTKYEDMAKKYEQVNQQSLKYRFETTNFERLLKEKELETIKNLQIKHLQMEKDMLDNTWKQRVDALNQRQKDLTKELDIMRANYEAKKDQYNTDIMNFKIEKDRLERALSDSERRLGESKEEIAKITREIQIRDQQKRLVQQKYSSLNKSYEQKVREIEKIQNELKDKNLQNKQLGQQLVMKQETSNRQIQKINEVHNNKVEGLEKELESKRKLLEQKQLQIRQFITKLSNHTNQKSVMYTEKQMEYQTTSMLFERTIQDLKKENQRLTGQLDITTRKLEEKMLDASNLLIDLKQSQSDRQLSDEQNKYKIESLSSKLADLLKEIDSLRSQLKSRITQLDQEREKHRQEKDKIEKSFNQLTTRCRLMEDAIQKAKLQKVSIIQREKALRLQLQAQSEQLMKVQEKTSKIEGGSIKIREENKYLKEIVQMLDSNYVEDEQQDENQIKILMKISEQISYLIQRNIHLESQNKSLATRSRNNDEEWLSSIQFLIESLLDYLNQTDLIGHKNVTKFVYSAEFKAQSLYDQKEKYMVYVENFIKELFQSIVVELSENTTLYERTISDMKKFVESYFNSRDQRYLESLRKCLNKFEC